MKYSQLMLKAQQQPSKSGINIWGSPNAKVVGHLHGDFLEMSTEDFELLNLVFHL